MPNNIDPFLPPREGELTKNELKHLVADPQNWWDAAHWGLNHILEKRALTGGRGLMAKTLGTPTELAKIAYEAYRTTSSLERLKSNLKEMEDLSKTSSDNRLIAGYTNTAQSLIGGIQLQAELIKSRDAAEMSQVALENAKYAKRTAEMNKEADERRLGGYPEPYGAALSRMLMEARSQIENKKKKK
jgi:hypothetical protein